MEWHPKTETPSPGSPCLLHLDTHDNPGAGLDEQYTIGWHNGIRWFDVHSPRGIDPGPWLLRWTLIPEGVAP